MRSNGANGSSDIADILAAIQNMASEKKPRQKLSAEILSGDTKSEETSAARTDDSLARLHVVLATPCGEISTKTDSRDLAPVVNNPGDIPRKIGNLKDNHIAKLSRVAANAWPGLVPQSEQGSTIMRCFGSVISPLLTKETAAAGSETQAKNCNLRDRLPALPLIPQNLAGAQIPEPSVSSRIAGLPEISRLRGGVDANNVRRAVPEPSMPSNIAGLPELPRSNRESAVGGSNARGVIRESTAQLLRPLIMRWVNENMPSMVEKALLAEDVLPVKR